MQTQLDAEYGGLGIQLLAINPFYAASSSALMAEGRDLPLLQDRDSEVQGQHDVWTTAFSAQYRDVVIVDRNGQQVDKYNLTINNLEDPENFDELRQLLIKYATPIAKEWHNSNNPVDVNNDTFVSPIDALFVINSLNQDGARKLGPRTSSDPYYFDVSNDGYISPMDALMVINFLTAQTYSDGEGEPPLTSQIAASAANDIKFSNDAACIPHDASGLDSFASDRARVIDRVFEMMSFEEAVR